MTPEQRQRAGRAVAARMSEMNATVAGVARAAAITPATLRGFIQGRTWPTDAVQSRLESVLRWHVGEIVTRAAASDSTASLTDSQLAIELARRLTEREHREAKLRMSDLRG